MNIIFLFKKSSDFWKTVFRIQKLNMSTIGRSHCFLYLNSKKKIQIQLPNSSEEFRELQWLSLYIESEWQFDFQTLKWGY